MIEQNPVEISKIKQEKSLKELLEFSILNIDKPSGPTSFDVSDFVRKTLKNAGIEMRKTSHFGTLDPKVTGALPIALNRACKLTGYFLGHNKEYMGVMRFHKDLSKKEVEEAIKKKFLGKIMQKPPVKSRVKRVEREREIKSFEILEQNQDNKKDFSFKTEVQGGTYIRKLISDLGDYLEISAHMLNLKRIRAGIFNENESISFENFEKAVDEYKNGNEDMLRNILIPGEIISEIYHVVQVKNDVIKKLLTGKPIFHEDLIGNNSTSANNKAKNIAGRDSIFKVNTGQLICAFNNQQFIGVYKVINDTESGIFAKPDFVLQPL